MSSIPLAAPVCGAEYCRSWRVPRTLEERLRVPEYRTLVRLFADHPGEESLFSIHNMCQVRGIARAWEAGHHQGSRYLLLRCGPRKFGPFVGCRRGGLTPFAKRFVSSRRRRVTAAETSHHRRVYVSKPLLPLNDQHTIPRDTALAATHSIFCSRFFSFSTPPGSRRETGRHPVRQAARRVVRPDHGGLRAARHLGTLRLSAISAHRGPKNVGEYRLLLAA